MTETRSKNIFGKPAGMQKIGKPAELHKDRLREMGKLARRFPISDVGEFGREIARDFDRFRMGAR